MLTRAPQYNVVMVVVGKGGVGFQFFVGRLKNGNAQASLVALLGIFRVGVWGPSAVVYNSQKSFCQAGSPAAKRSPTSRAWEHMEESWMISRWRNWGAAARASWMDSWKAPHSINDLKQRELGCVR